KANIVADALRRKSGMIAGLKVEEEIIRDLERFAGSLGNQAQVQYCLSSPDRRSERAYHSDTRRHVGERVIEGPEMIEVTNAKVAVGERVIEGPEMIEVTNAKFAVAKEKIKEARTHQKRNWDDYICLVEFAFNNSWHASIKCAPFKMLYGRKCRALICWDQVGERVIEGPEMIEVTNEKVAVAKEKQKKARTRQKSYADKHRRSIKFQPGDRVFLKVSPARGV
nr:putative nucleotidyltransferase, ribonuclease H [Tanacetum cinerariifolium]